MLFDSEPHDVFISYAREDSKWVLEHLYEPLAACRMPSGRPPRIFFDVGEHGIQLGEDFQDAIDKAVENTKKFIPVYSVHYFRKEMCMLELKLARLRDPSFRKHFLLPILKDSDAAQSVPFGFKALNWQSVADPSWFQRICQGLGLIYATDKVELQFLDQPGDIFASHTLPRLRVQVTSENQPIHYEDQILIQSEQGQLLGTTAVKTNAGIATFDDLSIPVSVSETRLRAMSITTSDCSVSEPFAVVARGEPAVVSTQSPDRSDAHDSNATEAAKTTLPVTGQMLFYESGMRLLVIGHQTATVYQVDGHEIGSRPLSVRRPFRLFRRNHGMILIADWYGNLQAIRNDASGFEVQFSPENRGFLVPADIDIVGDSIFVGFWQGSLFRISESGDVELYLKDPAGIQAIGAFNEHVFTCDFSGNLRIYHNRKLINTASIEPIIWCLKETKDCLIAVGNQQFYHLSPDGTQVLGFDMPIGEIDSVYELSTLPVVMDCDGKGIRFNSDLVITGSVLTQRGAKPVSADDAGEYCVFENPDGTHTLLNKYKIVFSNEQGAIAVSPAGDQFAISDKESIRLYNENEFLALMLAPSITPDSGHL